MLEHLGEPVDVEAALGERPLDLGKALGKQRRDRLGRGDELRDEHGHRKYGDACDEDEHDDDARHGDGARARPVLLRQPGGKTSKQALHTRNGHVQNEGETQAK